MIEWDWKKLCQQIPNLLWPNIGNYRKLVNRYNLLFCWLFYIWDIFHILISDQNHSESYANAISINRLQNYPVHHSWSLYLNNLKKLWYSHQYYIYFTLTNRYFENRLEQRRHWMDSYETIWWQGITISWKLLIKMKNVNLTSQTIEKDFNLYILDFLHAKTRKGNFTCLLEKQQVEYGV